MLLDCLSLTNPFPQNLHSHTEKANDPKYLENVHHSLCVTCHIFCVNCNLSGVMGQRKKSCEASCLSVFYQLGYPVWITLIFKGSFGFKGNLSRLGGVGGHTSLDDLDDFVHCS